MKDDRIYLLHIRDAIQQILTYTSSGKDSFFADRKTQDAVIRNLEIIGEATKRLSASLKSANPDISWKPIAGMRDNLGCDRTRSSRAQGKGAPPPDRTRPTYFAITISPTIPDETTEVVPLHPLTHPPTEGYGGTFSA